MPVLADGPQPFRPDRRLTEGTADFITGKKPVYEAQNT
jgi:hypothetical protein